MFSMSCVIPWIIIIFYSLLDSLGIKTLNIFWIRPSLGALLTLVLIIGLGSSFILPQSPNDPSNIPVVLALSVPVMILLCQYLILATVLVVYVTCY